MEIKILQRVAEEIGAGKLAKFGISKESWNWKKEAMIDLKSLSAGSRENLRNLLIGSSHIHGVNVMIKDIDTWEMALKDTGSAKCRTVWNFHALLIRFLSQTNGHRVYVKADDMGDVWLAHYVERIQFVEKHMDRGREVPSHCVMHYVYEMFGGKKKRNYTFWNADVRGKQVIVILANAGFYPETEELRTKYLEEAAKFGKIVKEVGKQYLAVGKGNDDLDGNPNRERDSWYSKRGTHVIEMARDGEAAKVVLDVFKEGDEDVDDRDDRIHVDSWFWHSVANQRLKKSSSDDPDDGMEDEDEDEKVDPEDLDLEEPEIEIPIHPLVAVFDLRRHLRIRIHINYLTEYIYDSELFDKLILPREMKDLVSMLMQHRENTFKDVIRGKSGGAVVLLTGKPGVGKTLTAEIYAESEGRALYSVQASQLGISPEDLEDELLKVFARARRWNAVMLLDEADVYVRQRASDLAQNAIVGVFLRVLEYQASVLFLTTNRPDDVDDAIASRCVARLCYAYPGIEDQKKIWKVLASASGIRLGAGVIDQVVKEFPELSGRDVKNLLKLSYLISQSEGKEIGLETVRFAKRFKPTA